MAKGLTPMEIADKQIKRSQAAVADYKAGVMSVTVSPLAEAAKQVDQWMAGLQRAYAEGTYVDACNAVTLADWQTKTANKGGLNYSSGVANARPSIEDFHTQLNTHQKSTDAILRGMPRGDLATNIQRMITQVTEASKFKFKKRR